MTETKRHPCSLAYDRVKRERPEWFNGSADGVYLANRIQEAFEAGWFEAERALDGDAETVKDHRP